MFGHGDDSSPISTKCTGSESLTAINAVDRFASGKFVGFRSTASRSTSSTRSGEDLYNLVLSQLSIIDMAIYWPCHCGRCESLKFYASHPSKDRETTSQVLFRNFK